MTNATTTRFSAAVSFGVIPSSMASLASGGGASVAAVESSSAMKARITRPR